MPIGAPATYPILEDIMLLARSYVNDSGAGATATLGEGQILVDASAISAFTIPFVNSAIRDVYRMMGITGVATLIQDNINLIGLTPVNGPLGLAAVDPSIQVSVSYAGYNDGSNVLNTNLKIPANILTVLKLWERQNGSNNPFVEMDQSQFGLPSRFQTSAFNLWEYRGDSIYMIGATQTNDIRIRAQVQLAGAVSGAGTDFTSLSVPILDSADAVAWKIVEKYAVRLEPEFYPTAKAQADEEVNKLIARQVRQQQSIPYHRQGYGSDDEQGFPPVSITGRG